MASRNEYLDIVKGVAIIMVVMGHCVQWGSGEAFYADSLFFEEPLFKFIYAFHMPLFMLISGYLFWYSLNRHTVLNVLVKRLKTLLIPIITWQTLFLVIVYHFIQGNDFSTGMLYSYLGTLWFLRSVLICSVLVLLGKTVFCDSWLYFLSVWVALLFVPKQYLVGLHVFMYPFFVVGYLWKKYHVNELYNRLSIRTKILLFTTAVSVFCGFYFFYDLPERSIYNNGTCLLGRENMMIQLLIDTARYLYGCSGAVMTMILLDLSYKGYHSSRFGKALISIGKNTLAIYIINDYSYELLRFVPTPPPAIYYAVIVGESIAVLVIAHQLSNVIKRNKTLGLLFFGAT